MKVCLEIIGYEKDDPLILEMAGCPMKGDTIRPLISTLPKGWIEQVRSSLDADDDKDCERLKSLERDLQNYGAATRIEFLIVENAQWGPLDWKEDTNFYPYLRIWPTVWGKYE